MLQDLNDIDWEAFGEHIYPTQFAKDIPNAIRQLRSPKELIREEALTFLFGNGQEANDIYQATPYIIPFIIELITHHTTPSKETLLATLSYILGIASGHSPTSVSEMRLYVQTYDVFKQRLPILLQLIRHPTQSVREYGVELLGVMTDDANAIIPELTTSLLTETDPSVLCTVLGSLKVLFAAVHRNDQEKQQYIPLLNRVVETHPSPEVQQAAARASVELVWTVHPDYRSLSPQVATLLSHALLTATDQSTDASFLMYQAQSMVYDLSRLEPEHLLQLFAHPALTSVQRHMVGRGLLFRAFYPLEGTASHWAYTPDMLKRKTELRYSTRDNYTRTMRLSPLQQTVCQAIATNEAIWEIPTNMFSFFFDLPDTREAFIKLLNDEKQH